MTSQTNRLSEPAQLDHGKPSARAACTARSAVCTSHPIRTPQVASRPASPGRRASPKYATAASPYASSAGQKRSSANGDHFPVTVTALRQLDELGELAFEPLQLQRNDQHVREQDDEDDEVRGRDVLLLGAHCNASRNSRRCISRRLPV